jgi:hypothetical protein
MRRLAVVLAVLVWTSLAGVRAADPSGRWSATFDSQVGEQQYTFEFVVKGSQLTGTVKGNLLGESQIQDGKIDGDKISFVENGKFQDMELRIVYSGTMTSADEIKFSRNVADLATEELLAKRVK